MDITSDSVSQIKAIIEHWTQAVREENIEEILAHHANDMVMFDVPPPLQSKGIEAYRKTWETFYSWATKPVLFEFTELKITASDTVAYAHAIGHCSGTDQKGKTENLQFRLTMGFQKKDGHWLITHEHHSLPNET